MMRLFTLISFVPVCILASACSHSVDTENNPLTPSGVNENPAIHDGQEIVVKGYAHIVVEGHILYESKGLFDEFAKKMNSGEKGFDPNAYEKYCLTIVNPGIIDPEMKKLGKTIVISGKFLAHYLHDRFMDIGACPLPTGIVVESFREVPDDG